MHRGTIPRCNLQPFPQYVQIPTALLERPLDQIILTHEPHDLKFHFRWHSVWPRGHFHVSPPNPPDLQFFVMKSIDRFPDPPPMAIMFKSYFGFLESRPIRNILPKGLLTLNIEGYWGHDFYMKPLAKQNEMEFKYISPMLGSSATV